MDRVALTYFGIIIALNTAFYNCFHTVPQFIIFNIVIIIFCVLVDKLEKKLRNTQLKIIDFIIYIFRKDSKAYHIDDRIEEYSIISREEAKFSSFADVKVKCSPEKFAYVDHFHWEQEEEMEITAKNNTEYQYHCTYTDDVNWTKVTVKPSNSLPPKYKKISVGYDVKNLKITNLKKRSFFSCRPRDKMKLMRMTAIVPSNLNPNKEAEFVIQNNHGEEIHKEKIQYDSSKQSYTKDIKYPRGSRKYIIKWGYGE